MILNEWLRDYAGDARRKVIDYSASISSLRNIDSKLSVASISLSSDGHRAGGGRTAGKRLVNAKVVSAQTSDKSRSKGGSVGTN